jgi:hypothetical protein
MKPQHRQKFDRLLAPGATNAELRCDYAVTPFDRVARDMEAIWGIDRLPGLVGPEMAARFGAAMAHLNDCMNAHDFDKTTAAAANCIKGLHALDAEARRLGHKPASPEVWQFEVDGKLYGLMRDGADWPLIAATHSHSHLTLVSMLEVANALSAYRRTSPMLAAVTDAFPGAVVTASRKPTPLESDLNDFLPF